MKLSPQSTKWWPIAAGLFVCSFTATLISIAFSSRRPSVIIPFVFLGVLVVVAKHWGALVGVAGSLVAGVIFAYRLYPPVNSLDVQSHVARSNLAWMVLAGVVLSYLFGPPLHLVRPRK